MFSGKGSFELGTRWFGPCGTCARIARLPGSEALLQAARDEDNAGLFGGMGGIMGVGARLMGAGLDMGQIQAVTRELMAYSRERGVGDTLGEIAGAIPGLGQFI